MSSNDPSVKSTLLTVRLIAERKRLRLNQAEFAAQCGITRTCQSNYETGHREPTTGYLYKAQAIGVDLHYLWGGIRSSEIQANDDALMEQELILWFRGLSDSAREGFLTLIQETQQAAPCDPSYPPNSQPLEHAP